MVSRVIPNSQSQITNVPSHSTTTEFCNARKAAFGDNYMSKRQGWYGINELCVKSVWDDHHANMLWLDSTYPTTATHPGAARGMCNVTSVVPVDIEAKSATGSASVTYSNIKVGPINSTFAQSWVKNVQDNCIYAREDIIHTCGESGVLLISLSNFRSLQR